MSLAGVGDAGIDWLVTGLVHGTALAVATGIACATVLSRARPALRSALWTVVLLKFLIPVGPALAVSLSAGIDGLLFGAEVQAAAATFVPAEALVAGPVAAPASSSLLELALAGLFLVYVLLVVGVGGLRLARHVGARRRVLRAPAIDPARAEVLARAAAIVGLRRLPAAVCDPDAASPHLVGLVRPVLVVPGWMRAGSAELEAALVHELAHIRRRDTWSRGLQLVVTTLFFFWPVVARASRRLDATREMACDDWVLARGQVDARAYARLLVSLVGRERPALASAALLGRRSQLEERIAHLMNRRRRKPALGPVAGLAVASWAVVALAGSARAEPAVRFVGGECVIDESLIDQILASYPDADADGNGQLTREEICAHNERMKRQLVDQAFSALPPDRMMSVAVRVDPSADADGDGNLSDGELEGVKLQLASTLDPRDFRLDPVAFPGRVCEESATASCHEGDGRDLRSE